MKKINVDALASLGSFSHIVSIPVGAGISVLSGQTALGVDYAIQGGDSILEQASFALANLKLALAAIDADFSDVAKLKCYVKGMDSDIAMSLPQLIEARGVSGCALTIIGVSFIAIEGCLVPGVINWPGS